MILFVLLGPTGIGKTELSIEIARRLSCPIINCDSRQIYRHIPIGTAAPTPEQQAMVRHYFIEILELDSQYSAARYEEEVLSLLERLSVSHSNMLMSGGSMMYIDAVCNGIDDIPTIAPEIRTALKQRYEEEGLEKMRGELRLLDPDYYAIADLRNPKRIIHALEVCYTAGKPYSSFRTNTRKERPFKVIKIGLEREREELFSRINARVDSMMAMGLSDEAKSLYRHRNLNALNTVGYKEMFRYLDGEWTLDMAVEKIKKNTRDYAKKQMTWFRHDTTIRWFHPDEKEKIFDYIDENIH